jgi:hypothetical protein
LRGLDGLNFLAADVQTGVGPSLAISLAAVAAAALGILCVFMPETGTRGAPGVSSRTRGASTSDAARG